MLMNLLPRQEEFFVLFENIAKCLTQAAQGLYEEIQHLKTAADPAQRVLQHKKNANTYAQRLFTLMHKTFITPFDRYDIHRLNSSLYDIVNMINLTAQRFPAYDIQQVPSPLIKLAEVCYQSAKLVEQVVMHLRNLSHNGKLMETCDKIKAYESEADQLLMDGVAKLLREESDVKNIIKLNEIYDLLETITDKCQEIAFIIEGIVLEYA